MPIKPKFVYETHIAADVISEEAKKFFFNLGFVENVFYNYRAVQDSIWRATKKSTCRWTKTEWSALESVLRDNLFEGTLIEEVFKSDWLVSFPLESSTQQVSASEPRKLVLSEVPAAHKKECDIHLSVDLDRMSQETIHALDEYFDASVDRHPDGQKRIYTITCESFDHGIRIKNILINYLGQFPDIKGKFYVEKIIRYIRIPNNSRVLPRVTISDAEKWLTDHTTSTLKSIST